VVVLLVAVVVVAMVAEALEECRPELELLSWATLLRSRDLESLVDIFSRLARDVKKTIFYRPAGGVCAGFGAP